MTGAERADLQADAERMAGRDDHPEVYLLFLGLFWYPAILSATTLFALAVLGRASGVAIAHGAWRDDVLAGWVVWLVLLAAWGWGVAWTAQALWQDWTRKADLARRYAQDLHEGAVHEERVRVCGVKLFREPEHGMFVVFVRVDTGQVLVLYDHDSVDAINYYPVDNQPTLRIAERLCIVRFPGTGRKRYDFSGATVPWPRQVALGCGPQRWPEENTDCPTPWGDLEARYGA